jgi:PilZ domain
MSSSVERRKYPRVPVQGQLASQLVSSAQDVIVRDLSAGGFLIESLEAFRENSVHEFRLATANGRVETRLKARSVYSHLRRVVGGPTSYLTGFEFVEPRGQEAQERVLEMISQLTSVVTTT